MEKPATGTPADAISPALDKRLSKIESNLDRIAEHYDFLRHAVSALQRDLVKAIPAMQQLDHLEEIKAQRKRDKEENRRSFIRTSYHYSLPGLLEKMRKKGEDIPYHPGQILDRRLGNPGQNALGFRGYSEQSYAATRKLAADMGIRHSDLCKFLNGNMRVSLKLAAALAKAVGETPEYWLDLQKVHDAWWAKNPYLKIAPELRAK